MTVAGAIDGGGIRGRGRGKYRSWTARHQRTAGA
jgi:hypothetical protein